MNIPSLSKPRFSALHIAQYYPSPDAKPEHLVMITTDTPPEDDDKIYFNLRPVGQSDALGKITKSLRTFESEAADRHHMAEHDAYKANFSFPGNLLNWLKRQAPKVPYYEDYMRTAFEQFSRVYPNLRGDLAQAVETMEPVENPSAELPVDLNHVKEAAHDAIVNGRQGKNWVVFYTGTDADDLGPFGN